MCFYLQSPSDGPFVLYTAGAVAFSPSGRCSSPAARNTLLSRFQLQRAQPTIYCSHIQQSHMFVNASSNHPNVIKTRGIFQGGRAEFVPSRTAPPATLQQSSTFYTLGDSCACAAASANPATRCDASASDFEKISCCVARRAAAGSHLHFQPKSSHDGQNCVS